MGLAYILAPLSGKTKKAGAQGWPSWNPGRGCDQALCHPLIRAITTPHDTEQRQDTPPIR